MILSQMADKKGVEVSLRYRGPDVDAGTMPIDDVISALQGFAGAYGKIASQNDPEAEHQLRVVSIKTESFAVLIAAWVLMNDPGSQLKAFEFVTKASRWIIETIAKLIEAKKASKGKPFNVAINGNNNTVVLTCIEGVKVSMAPDQFKIMETKMIDSDLDKIADPLKSNRIDHVELTMVDGTDTIKTEIGSTEREYFRPEETIATTSREAEVDGNLVSLNKETNRGTFRLKDGRGVPYRYIGQDVLRFHRDFSYRGPVRITCTASLDQSLIVKQLEIRSIEKLQGSLPLE